MDIEPCCPIRINFWVFVLNIKLELLIIFNQGVSGKFWNARLKHEVSRFDYFWPTKVTISYVPTT